MYFYPHSVRYVTLTGSSHLILICPIGLFAGGLKTVVLYYLIYLVERCIHHLQPSLTTSSSPQNVLIFYIPIKKLWGILFLLNVLL